MNPQTRAHVLEILQRYNAPTPAARLILHDMEEAGLLGVLSSPNTERLPGLFGKDVAEDLEKAALFRERASTLAAELAASKSPAIRGVAKRLRAVLEGD